jgi:hypothetical protein
MAGSALRLIPAAPELDMMIRQRKSMGSTFAVVVTLVAFALLASWGRVGAPMERLAVLPDNPYAVPCFSVGVPCQKLSPSRLQAILANVKGLESQIKGFEEQTANYDQNERKVAKKAMRSEYSVEEALQRTAADKDKFVKFIETPGPVGYGIFIRLFCRSRRRACFECWDFNYGTIWS